jgi:hypothetical protein
MLDAWADGRLVLVKLDHGILPFATLDLTSIDASFESGWTLGLWPQVACPAKEAMNAALLARSEAFWSLRSRQKNARGKEPSSAFGRR